MISVTGFRITRFGSEVSPEKPAKDAQPLRPEGQNTQKFDADLYERLRIADEMIRQAQIPGRQGAFARAMGWKGKQSING